ncbi:MAG: hypothetical protein JF627_03465, partial [Alphaproteobacteria bacterium]|nr:hypothetical protein [Alphaproteobacteria bacterium]
MPVPAAVTNPGPQIANPSDVDDSVEQASAAGEAPPFFINAGLGIREIYNSNALGVQGGRSDWMTQGQA